MSEFRVGDIVVFRPLHNQRAAGKVIGIEIPTDSIPAVANLDRGETFMLASELVRLARRTELR